jgi:hypothetical protein
MMEGTNQILLCAHVVQDLFKLTAVFSEETPSEDLLTTLNETVHTVYERYPSTQAVFDEVEESLNAVLSGDANSTEETLADVKLVFSEMTKTIIEGFGWEPPKEVPQEDFTEYGNSIVSIFNLTFGISSYFLHPLFSPLSKATSTNRYFVPGYFCVCVGLVCLIIGILTLLSLRHHAGYSRLRYISIGANILVGLGLALLSTAVLTDAAGNLGTTPWTLPALTLILLGCSLLTP